MSIYTSIAILSILLGVAACSPLGPASERPIFPNTSKGYTVQSRDPHASGITADAILRSLNEHKNAFSYSPRDCRIPISGPMVQLVPSRYILFEHPFKPNIAIALFEPTTSIQILQITQQQAGQSRFYVSRDRSLINQIIRIIDTGRNTLDEQIVPSDGHRPSSGVSSAGPTAPADAH